MTSQVLFGTKPEGKGIKISKTITGSHLVVIAGDSNALGVGDLLIASVASGFARTIPRQLQKLKKTRQKWTFCNAGGFGRKSTSRSWYSFYLQIYELFSFVLKLWAKSSRQTRDSFYATLYWLRRAQLVALQKFMVQWIAETNLFFLDDLFRLSLLKAS